MEILVFDNYDSFTYNLVHMVEYISGTGVDVYKNDEISIDDAQRYDRIILSPGPGVPKDAGLLMPFIRAFAADKKILGVCLGHQAIAEVFGGSLINLKDVYHGIAKPVKVLEGISTVHLPNPLFKDTPEVFEAGRYHSWVVDKATMPEELEITATDSEGLVMALQHKKYNVQGVQFHPESILTPMGEKILKNWLV